MTSGGGNSGFACSALQMDSPRRRCAWPTDTPGRSRGTKSWWTCCGEILNAPGVSDFGGRPTREADNGRGSAPLLQTDSMGLLLSGGTLSISNATRNASSSCATILSRAPSSLAATRATSIQRTLHSVKADTLNLPAANIVCVRGDAPQRLPGPTTSNRLAVPT